MLDELERLEQAATPGPWLVHTDLRKWVTNSDPCAEWGINRNNDAAFVAAARNALPALLRLARAARAMYEALDDSRLSEPRPLEEHQARFDLRAALADLESNASENG